MMNAVILADLQLMLSQGKDLKDDKVNAGAIKVKKNRLARQYMNRRGGFNRPLPAERTGEKVSHFELSKFLMAVASKQAMNLGL